jgi:iron complex outermembrane receptor protein
MLSITRSRLYISAAPLALIAAGMLALTLPAAAQQVADNAARTGDIETVIVTGSTFDTNLAPAKASLNTMEPQTIINKTYIQDSVAATADYTTILAIAPSMTGQDINGPGLSDGGVKNTLRGLPDGDFVLAFDGVPFGDTNGPSHHSESYFPGVTIGSIVVDRGPGNAGTLGAATFGGNVNLFSEALTPDSHVRASGTYGSWNTQSYNLNYQTGDVDLGGLTTRTLVNANFTSSNGYLIGQNTDRQNYLIKTQFDVAPGWTLTAFSNYNGLYQHLNDNSGETAAQVNTYGETYALQGSNPKLGNYAAYNPEVKKTDMDYLRLQGSLGSIGIDNTAYTYAYVNRTVSATNIEQTQADIAKGVTEGLGTIVNGTKYASDVPGYTKLNAYRVWGDIMRVSDDFDFGWLTGQVRAGLWAEGSATQRQRKDFDITQCVANGCNPFHTSLYSDSTLVAKTTSAFYLDGYYEYVEHSDWSQYQPFVELELHPLEDLTITPGFKYIYWDRSVNAVLEQKTVPVVPYSGSFTTTHDLPFLEANYKLQQNWSVYAQYAQGIYVPDISSFEQSTPLLVPPKSETTTNYQVGTVYYADHFTFDGDLYYIGIDNNIAYVPCNTAPFNGPASESCGVNTGTATYKGVEGEGTYAFQGALEGLSFFASGSINNSKTAGAVVKTAPLWTEADGLVYKIDDFQFSLIDKLVGQQYAGKQTLTPALSSFYRLPAYNNMDLKGAWTIGSFQLAAGIYNALNERNLLAITVNDKAAIGSSPFDLADRGNSLDQYFFAPSRNYQITLTARF